MIQTIYIDMDGVIADYDGAMLRHFGVGEESMLTSAERWVLINDYEAAGGQWFLDLEPTVYASRLLSTVDGLKKLRGVDRVVVLSATGNDFFKHSKQKKNWLLKTGAWTLFDDVIVVPKAECKRLYANPQSLLIDDNWERCVRPFIEAGGWGIHYTDLQQCILKLDAILNGQFKHPQNPGW